MVQWGEAVRMSEKTRTWRGKQFNDSDGAVKTGRGLSALLALLLLVLLSTSAFPVMADSANVAMITGTNTSYATLQAAFDAAAPEQTVQLLDNIDSEAKAGIWPLTVAKGKNFTLDLAGYVIDRGLTAATSDGFVLIVNGSLTLNDTIPNSTHTNTNLPAGGVITGGNASGNGGGVYLNGSFSMNGGTIYGNRGSSDISFGGGVYINGGTMTMTGGAAIKGNSAGGYGGGIAIDNSGTFTMSGGEISGNTANSGGGGIMIDSGSSMTMSGGAITGNSASYVNGGGVYVNGNAGSFTISGGTISGNTMKRAANNVYLHGEKKITFDDELSEETSIGITMETPGVFTNSTNIAYNVAEKFSSDDQGYKVGKNADGQLYLGFSLTYKANGGTGDDVTETYVSGSSVTVKNITDRALGFSREGYAFTGWNTKSDGSGTAYADGAFVTLAGNLTLYAQWAVASITTGSGEGAVTTYYDSLHKALNAASSGDTITLLMNISAETEGSDASLIFDFYDTSVTLDLNGKTIDLSQINPTGQTGLAFIINDGNLTLKDGSEEQTGQITGGNGVMVIGGTFNMESGTITGCKNGVRIPALYITAGSLIPGGSGGTFNLSGGSITRNTDSGVSYESGTFIVSGSPIVTGNGSETQPANVVLADHDNRKIGIEEAGLGDGAEIGVTLTDTSAASTVFTSGLYGNSETPKGSKTNFSSDNPAYAVGIVPAGQTDAGEAYLTDRKYKVTYDANGATSGTVPVDTDEYSSGAPVIVKMAAGLVKAEGETIYAATGWTISGDSSGKVYSVDDIGYTNDTFTITGDTTLLANWVKAAAEITRSGVTTQYATLWKALEAAQNSDTVKVLIDINEKDATNGLSYKSVTIDLNEKNVTYGSIGTSSNLTVTGGGKLNIFQVLASPPDANAFTLDNAEMSVEAFHWKANSVNIKNGGKLELKGTDGSTAYLGGSGNDEGSGNGFTLSIDKNGSKISLNKSFIWNIFGGHERVLSELKKYASEADEENVAVCTTTRLDPLNMTLQYQYIVSFDGNGGAVPQGAADMTPQKFTPGAEAKALRTNTFEWEGYHFTGWNTQANGSGQSFTDQQKIAAEDIAKLDPLILYAQWAENEYEITYVLNNGTNDPDNPAKYKASELPLTINDPTRDGWIFMDWFTDADFTPPAVNSIPAGSAGNMTFYAKWGHTVSYSWEGTIPNGAVLPPSAVKAANDTVKRADAPTVPEGYTFTGWKAPEGLTVAADGTFTMPANDVTFTGTWSMNEYTVTVTPTGPGSIAVMKDGTAPYTGTFHKGETFSLIITPEANAFFDKDSLQVCYYNDNGIYNCSSLSDSYTMPAADVIVSGIFYGYTLPGAETRLEYSELAQQLITAGSVSGDDMGLFRFEYCPGEQGTAPAAGDAGWTSDAAAVKETNAGTYYIWYRIVSVSTSGSTVMKSFDTPLEVTIAPCGVTLKAESNAYMMIYSGQDYTFGNRFTVWNGESEVTGLSFSGVSASGTGKNAGEYPVTFTGVTVNETKDTTGNYVVTGTIAGTLTISPKQVTIGNLSVGKEYDGSADAEVNYEQAVIQGKIQGDELTVDSCTGTFDNKNAGERNVSITCVLGGSAKGNYTLDPPGPITAAISKKELTVTAAAQTREYKQGNLSVTVLLQLNGVLDAEKDKVSLDESVTGTMAYDTAGTEKPVTLPTLVLKGDAADTGNYSLQQPTGVKVEITRLPVTIRAKDQSVAIGGTINKDPIGTGTAQIEIKTGALSGNDEITFVTLTGSATDVLTTTGTITPSAARVNDNDTDTGNYDFIYEDGTLTVTLPPINIKVVDEKGNAFAPVDLKLTGGSTDLSWNTSDTGGNPHEVTGLLPDVEYTLKETDVSNIYYKFTADTVFSFDASGKIAYNNADKAADWDESTKTLTITNNPVSVTVRKVDENGNRLAGAKFSLYDGDGNYLSYDWVSSDTADHVITVASRGESYIIKEDTPPAGYIKASLFFTIADDGRSVELDPASESKGHSIADDGAIEFLNKKTSVSISKVDETGAPVSGAKLQLKDEGGNVVNLDGKALEWDSGTEAQVIKGLYTNTDYILHEAETPAGYIPAADLMFMILSDGNLRINGSDTESSSIGFVNTRTSVSIKKVNTDGNVLSGAELQIVKVDDGGNEEIVHGWTSTAEAAVITGKLAVGVPYILRETVPPAGYGTAADVAFQLKADGTIDTDKTKTTAEVENGVILFRNEPTSVSIKKVDLDSGIELPGANLQILRESDGGGETKVHEWTSSENDAEVVTGKLAVGVSYILRETVPPAGYKTAADVTIQLKADGTIDTDKTTAKIAQNGVILFENEPTSVSIYVVDREHPETKVAGADVTLNPNPTHQWTSSGTDPKTVSRLTVGTEYTLTVTNTPKNYDKPDSQTFKVKADGTVEALPAELDAAGNIIIKLPRINYTVTFDFDGGNLSSYDTNTYTAVIDAQGKTTGLRQTVNHGSTASDPGTPSKDGSSFQGWYLSETAYDFNTPVTTNNIILKAKWNLIIRSVTVTPGANMTKTEESGDVSQNVNSGSEIKAVVYTANDGYYFPENYSVGSDKGISVTRNSDTQITVSGTPTADALIRLAPPSLKSENTVAAPGFEVITGADEASPSTVRIICRTEDADIWYTTDGSEPADTNSNMQKYVEPITVSETSTIKAFAKKAGMYPSGVAVEEIVIAKAMTQKVIIHHVKNNGSWGIPSDMPVGEEELTIVIKDGEVVSEGKVSMEISDGKKNSGEIEVRFIPEVENLSDITVSGPEELIGAAPMLQKYRLSYKASFKDVINIYVTWNDGRTSEPERIKVYALPEDEIGAYRLHKDGTKEYLLFHTYDICMRWLGSDELCCGYERCFHKESPYENPFVTATGVIGEIVN